MLLNGFVSCGQPDVWPISIFDADYSYYAIVRGLVVNLLKIYIQEKNLWPFLHRVSLISVDSKKRIPDEASNGELGVNSVNLFCCKQNVLDLIMELFFMLIKYCLYYMKILIEKIWHLL